MPYNGNTDIVPAYNEKKFYAGEMICRGFMS